MRYMLLIVMLLGTLIALATPTYYPSTVLVEDFAASWCVTCLDAVAGINVLHDHYNDSEMISVRYYTTSGDLSNPEVDERFDHYQVFGVPSVFFNGKFRTDGGGVDIADGTRYLNMIKPFIFHGSPLKMEISSFDPSTGDLSVNITMLSGDLVITDQHLRFLLIEDEVQVGITNVVRSIQTQAISLSGQGSQISFNHSFDVNPSWNPTNLWAAVFVQLDNDAILQTAHTKALPEYLFRAALDWDPNIVDEMNITYLSQPFYFYNLGLAEDYTMQIVVDSAPDNWYFNYCDELGGCFPGSIPIPLSMEAGEAVPFHLNLMVGESGIATFHCEISSPNTGTYIFPFRYRTSDVSIDDPNLIPMPFVLGKNYPNPFKSRTVIPVYTEKGNSSMSLEVFNIKGQKVQELHHTNLTIGTNQLNVELSDQLPNGVYYYRIKGYPQSPARKMLMVR